jgi:hypothetical protein
VVAVLSDVLVVAVLSDVLHKPASPLAVRAPAPAAAEYLMKSRRETALSFFSVVLILVKTPIKFEKTHLRQ